MAISFFGEVPHPLYPEGDGGQKPKWFDGPQTGADFCP